MTVSSIRLFLVSIGEYWVTRKLFLYIRTERLYCGFYVVMTKQIKLSIKDVNFVSELCILCMDNTQTSMKNMLAQLLNTVLVQ